MSCKHKALLLAILVACHLGHSQSIPADEIRPYFAAIVVQDIDQSISWYQRNLGFEVVNKVEREDLGFKQSNLSREGFALELIEDDYSVAVAEIKEGKHRRTKPQGYFKLGFLVSDLDVWIAFLTEKGVAFHGDAVTDPVSGKRMVIILDPDGNRIQLFES